MPIGSIKLSVVVPVFNERNTIEEILTRIQAVDVEKEIILVDDASTDGTREFLQGLRDQASSDGMTILFHEKNKGKGAALQSGFQHVTGDLVVIQDADLEYDPREYGSLMQPILEGRADVVYGSRFLGGPHRVLFFWHYLGNRFLTFVCNMFSNLNLSDMETGYKMFRSEVLDNLELKSRRFGFEPEFTVKVSKRRYRVYEVPISYGGRTYAEGKKITWKDGLAALYFIVRFRIKD
jgi:glycosyltransferase involved in cell wall biosynthesis